MSPTQTANYGVKEIAELFPSLMQIKDASLREKESPHFQTVFATGSK